MADDKTEPKSKAEPKANLEAVMIDYAPRVAGQAPGSHRCLAVVLVDRTAHPKATPVRPSDPCVAEVVKEWNPIRASRAGKPTEEYLEARKAAEGLARKTKPTA